jgi:hypothetical protein
MFQDYLFRSDQSDRGGRARSMRASNNTHSSRADGGSTRCNKGCSVPS